jgi:hypothetical protein
MRTALISLYKCKCKASILYDIAGLNSFIIGAAREIGFEHYQIQVQNRRKEGISAVIMGLDGVILSISSIAKTESAEIHCRYDEKATAELEIEINKDIKKKEDKVNLFESMCEKILDRYLPTSFKQIEVENNYKEDFDFSAQFFTLNEKEDVYESVDLLNGDE